jgi:hypothetical protein
MHDAGEPVPALPLLLQLPQAMNTDGGQRPPDRLQMNTLLGRPTRRFGRRSRPVGMLPTLRRAG